MIEWATLHTWQTDWDRPSQEAIDKRKKYFDRSPSLLRAQLVTMIHSVRTGHERLVSNYGFGLTDQLEHDSSVASTPHLDRLLEIAQRRLRSPYVHDQVWFEAISMFDQAVSLLLIEHDEPMERIGTTMAQLIDLMGEELFVPGYERADLYAYHDPKRDYMVALGNVGINQPLNRPHMRLRKVELNCRKVRGDGIAFLHHRLKKPFTAWLKIQRQLQKGLVDDPFEVSDRCGLMIVSPTMEGVKAFADNTLTFMRDHGAVVTEPLRANYDVNVALDRKNTESSKDYKLAKARVFWDDQEIELQFLTFADYFSSLRALSDMNHELYKLNQAIRYFFPLLWPTSRFRVDWTNPSVRRMLRAWKIAQLGWAIKEQD